MLFDDLIAILSTEIYSNKTDVDVFDLFDVEITEKIIRN